MGPVGRNPKSCASSHRTTVCGLRGSGRTVQGCEGFMPLLTCFRARNQVYLVPPAVDNGSLECDPEDDREQHLGPPEIRTLIN